MAELEIIKNKLLQSFALDEETVLAINKIGNQLTLLHNLEETLFNSDLYLVYLHITPDGKKYIGITKNLPNTRWNEGSGYESQRTFYKAIQKFGWNNIEHTIVAAGLTEEEAKTLETELIKKHKTNDPQYGYNKKLSIATIESTEKLTKTSMRQEKRQEKNDVEISREIIEKYSIKTVNGIIYYLSDTDYVKESEQPIIEKDLLSAYNVMNSKRRREIIKSIMILSRSSKEEVFPNTFNGSKLNQEEQLLLSGFLEAGYKQISEIDIISFVNWLNETTESVICVPMILEEVFHLPRQCSLTIGKRLGVIIRKNGWVALKGSRVISKYGRQRGFRRELFTA